MKKDKENNQDKRKEEFFKNMADYVKKNKHLMIELSKV